MQAHGENTTVTWNWGQGTASGRITQVFTRKVTRTIKGAQITRNASRDNPAYLIKQAGGDVVLKSHSEVQA